MKHDEAVTEVNGNMFSVVSANEDIIIVTALASAGDAIPVNDLIGDMKSFGFHLGYVVPSAREFQFKSV